MRSNQTHASPRRSYPWTLLLLLFPLNNSFSPCPATLIPFATSICETLDTLEALDTLATLLLP
jgi:hypothetical protein